MHTQEEQGSLSHLDSAEEEQCGFWALHCASSPPLTLCFHFLLCLVDTDSSLMDLSPLMSFVRARGEPQRNLLDLMGLKMSHCPHGLRVQSMLVEKNVINAENICPVVLLLGFRHGCCTRSAEKLSLGNCSVLGREADTEAFLLKTPRGHCGPWPWPHHACSRGQGH